MRVHQRHQNGARSSAVGARLLSGAVSSIVVPCGTAVGPGIKSHCQQRPFLLINRARRLGFGPASAAASSSSSRPMPHLQILVAEFLAPVLPSPAIFLRFSSPPCRTGSALPPPPHNSRGSSRRGCCQRVRRPRNGYSLALRTSPGRRQDMWSPSSPSTSAGSPSLLGGSSTPCFSSTGSNCNTSIPTGFSRWRQSRRCARVT